MSANLSLSLALLVVYYYVCTEGIEVLSYVDCSITSECVFYTGVVDLAEFIAVSSLFLCFNSPILYWANSKSLSLYLNYD